GFGYLGAGRIGDKGRAVEGDLSAVPPLLRADPVRGDQRHQVRGCMALHDALPVAGGIELRIVRLGADGRRIEQDFRALQGHGAGGLREPLVPADADADAARPRLPDLEAGIARREIEFLRIAGSVRYM